VLRRVKGLFSQMGENTANAVFVAVLLAVAALVIIATVVDERGVRFSSPFSASTEQIISRALWALLWLPGLALCVAQFARARRLSLALGIALQIAALVAYEVKQEWLGPAAAAGVLGLVLPLEAPALRHGPWRCRLWSVAWLLATPALGYGGGLVLALIVGLLWVYHAAWVWPRVAEAVDDFEAHEQEQNRRAKLWVCRTIAWIARPWRRAGPGSRI
jgi:Flp pilus assembly pilin Flp